MAHAPERHLSVRLIARLFDSEVRHVSDVTRKLQVVGHSAPGSPQATLHDTYATILHQRLLSYLEGKGHPQGTGDLVTAGPDDSTQLDPLDPLFRVKLFLLVTTGQAIIPTGIIMVEVHDTDSISRFEQQTPIFRTCTRTVQICSCQEVIEQFLTTSMAPPHLPFERWFHTHLLLACTAWTQC